MSDEIRIDAELQAEGIGVTADAEQVCDVLRIDRRTLGRLIATKAISAGRVAGRGSSRLLFRRREIARFLAHLEA